jgi:hypothetical protein
MGRFPVLTRIVFILVAILLAVCFYLRKPHHPIKPVLAPSRAPADVTPERAFASSPAIFLPGASAHVDSAAAAGLLAGEVRSTRTSELLPRAQLVLFCAGAAFTVPAPDGRFRFVPPAPGDYVLLSVEAPGFQPFLPAIGQSPVVFHARDGSVLSDLILWLEPAATCTIQVVDPASRPVAGASVTQRVPEGPSAVTSAEGEAKLAAAPDALFEARAAGYAPARERSGHGPECNLTLHLKPLPPGGLREGAISGRVVDTAGLPVEGVRVSAERAGGDPQTLIARRRLGAEAEAHSDVEGRFRLEPLAEDTWELTARDAAHAVARVRARTGQTDIVLSLPFPAMLRGVVRAADGGPVTAFAVFASERRSTLERGPTRSLTVLDGRGRFELPLSPGDYLVSAAARELGSAPEQTVTVGQTGADIVLTLAHGGRIRGTVRDEQTGAAVAAARVELEGADDGGDTPLPTVSAATTGSDGRFTLGGVSPGTRALLVTAAGHHGRIVSGIAVSEEPDVEVTVALAPTSNGEEPSIELTGIGCVLGPQDDVVILGECFPGGGGFRAGLQAGDAIVRVDGDAVSALGFSGTVGRIRGPEGSTVVLTIRRSSDERDVAIVRTRVRPPGP